MSIRFKGALIFAIFCLMTHLAGGETNQQLSTSEMRDPKVRLDSVKLKSFSAGGTIKYTLQAKQLRQDIVTNETFIREPVLTFENPKNIFWEVKANSGKSFNLETDQAPNNDVIQLYGQVQIIRSAEKNQKLSITSSIFSLFPNRQYAEIDGALVISSPNVLTSAAGLSVNLKTGILMLSSDSIQKVETKIKIKN